MRGLFPSIQGKMTKISQNIDKNGMFPSIQGKISQNIDKKDCPPLYKVKSPRILINRIVPLYVYNVKSPTILMKRVVPLYSR